MRKKIFLTCFLLVITVLCFVLLSPAFADMEKVDEAELARTNASVTGASVKDQSAGVEKDLINPQTLPTNETLNRNGYSPEVNKVMDAIGLDLNVNGQTTFGFYVGGVNSTVTGSITSVKMH